MILIHFFPVVSIKEKFSLAIKSALRSRLKASTDSGFSHCTFGSCNKAILEWMMHLSFLLRFLLLHLPFYHQTCHFCEWSQAVLPTIHGNLLEPARKPRRGVKTRASGPAIRLNRKTTLSPGFPLALTSADFCLGGQKTRLDYSPWGPGLDVWGSHTMVTHIYIHQHRQHTVYLDSVH